MSKENADEQVFDVQRVRELIELMKEHELNEVDAPVAPDMSAGPGVLAATALEASGLMPTRQAEGVERAEIVRQAIRVLGERQRTALMLSRFENMSYIEIAETMNLTTKAVKSLLSRARVNLREILQSYIENGEFPNEVDS